MSSADTQIINTMANKLGKVNVFTDMMDNMNRAILSNNLNRGLRNDSIEENFIDTIEDRLKKMEEIENKLKGGGGGYHTEQRVINGKANKKVLKST